MLSIVVLSYNRRPDVEQNIPKLLAWCHANKGELIFVDNNSSDGTQEFIRGLLPKHPELKFVENAENRGVAGGRNDGFKLAQGKIILSIDDDSSPETDFLDKLPSIFEAYPEAGLMSPLIRHAKENSPQNDNGSDPTWVANFHGCCHAFRSDLIEKIGYQDELCTFGGEELDFSIRANKVGLKTLYHPDYICHHNSFVRPIEEQMKRWSRWVYNYARVLGKNFPAVTASKFAREYTKQFAFKLVRNGQSSYADELKKEGSRGLTDGLASAEPCPNDTLKFYLNPELTPEYGNRTLLRKLVRKFIKSKPDPALQAGRRTLS